MSYNIIIQIQLSNNLYEDCMNKQYNATVDP